MMATAEKLKEITKKAEQIIDNFELDERKIKAYNDKSEEDLSADQLRKMFKQAVCNYIIFDSEIQYRGDTHIPLGSSKLFGLPHLPDSINFPENQVFLAQINLSDIKEFDIHNVFPDKGIIYFFGHYYGDGACSTYYYDGPIDALKIKEYPASEYLKKSDVTLFMKNNRLEPMKFDKDSGFLCFNFVMPGYENDPILDIAKNLGKVLKKELGNDISGSSHRCFLLGRPIFWQDEERDYDLNSSKLIFCIPYEEGHYNFFVEAKDGKVETDKVFVQGEFQSFNIYSGS